jgi:hypothetical protein
MLRCQKHGAGPDVFMSKMFMKSTEFIVSYLNLDYTSSVPSLDGRGWNSVPLSEKKPWTIQTNAIIKSGYLTSVQLW